MSNMMEIIRKYTAAEMTLEEANSALAQDRTGIHLDPQKNILSEAEKRVTTIGYYPNQANGFGLLDTGTGSFDKVEVRSGKLVNCDCGEMYALYIIAGKTYHVKGNTLAD